jgi:adenosylcobinamide-GDP ribazoletransferase
VKDFVDALRFLTRVPMPAAAGVPGFGARAFPLVGLLLGATAVAIDALLGAVDPGVRNVAILAAGAVLTGAIHYDGLADVLDAAGAATREERLRIMRDGTVGVFAVLGLIFVVAAELAALSALHGDIRWRALLLAPVVGRAAMVLSAFEVQNSYARCEGRM